MPIYFGHLKKIPTLNKNVFAIVIARGCCGVRPDTGVFRNSCFDLKGSSIDDIAIFRVKVSKFQNEYTDLYKEEKLRQIVVRK